MAAAASISGSSRRVIEPYVCSTPLDFDAERDFLTTTVFPQLAEVALSHGGLFKPVDWHRSLGSEHYSSARVVLLALDCIRHCSPFFIGLLGETYGHHVRPQPRASETEADPMTGPVPAPADAYTVQENLRLAAQAGYKWLDISQQYNSITETEILQAAFLSADDDRIAGSEASEFRHFYFRQPEHADGLYLDLPELKRHQKLLTFAAESDYAEYKLKDLKTRIAKKGLAVKYFKSLQELGTLVMSDWLLVIQKLCPPIPKKSVYTEGFIQEAIAQELYLQSRQQVFVRTPSVDSLMEALRAFAKSSMQAECTSDDVGLSADKNQGMTLMEFESPKKMKKTAEESLQQHEKSVFLLTGPRGCGKTAVLANWLRELQENDRVKVVAHFSASGAEFRDVTMFMKRSIVELRAAYLPADERSSQDEDFTGNFARIQDSFVAALSLGPCLLILDGVDELGSAHGLPALEVRTMAWLPARLPPTCRVILTMTASDISYKCVRQRSDCIEWTLAFVQQAEERMSLLREYLGHRGRGRGSDELSTEHAAQLAGHRLSASPLYMLMVASELKDPHVMQDLDGHISLYANESGAGATAMKGLWCSVLRRWCRDYSWTKYSDSDVSSSHADAEGDDSKLQTGGWVADALRLIACSQNGLLEEEVLGSLEALGYTGSARVRPISWNLFYNAARCLFLLHVDGTIAVAHQHFLDILDYVLMGSIVPPSMDVAAAGPRPLQSAANGQSDGSACHEALASFMMRMPWAVQRNRLSELLWHLEKNGQWSVLCDYIASPYVFLKLYGNASSHQSRACLRRYYEMLCQRQFDLVQKYKVALLRQGLSSSDSFQMKLTSAHATSSEERDDTSHSLNKLEYEGAVRPSTATTSSRVLPKLRRHISFSAPPARGREKRSQLRHMRTPAELNPNAIIITDRRERVELGRCLASFLLTSGERAAAMEVLQGTHHFACQSSLLSTADQAVTAGVEELIGDTLASTGCSTYAAMQWYRRAYHTLIDAYQAAAHDEHAADKGDEFRINEYKQKGEILLKLGVEELELKDLEAAETHLAESRIYMKEGLCRLGKMKAAYYTGKLRVLQSRSPEARKLMEKSLHYVEHWFGPFQKLVASICHDLGCLLSSEFSAAAHSDGTNWDTNEALSYLQKAFRIRRHICPNDLSMADTLFEFGFIIQRSSTKTAKKEALELLSECLDIRLKKLGTKHQHTRAVSAVVHDLAIVLHLGHYQFGNGTRTSLASENHGTKVHRLYRASSAKTAAEAEQHQSNSSNGLQTTVTDTPTLTDASAPKSAQQPHFGRLSRSQTAPPIIAGSSQRFEGQERKSSRNTTHLVAAQVARRPREVTSQGRRTGLSLALSNTPREGTGFSHASIASPATSDMETSGGTDDAYEDAGQTPRDIAPSNRRQDVISRPAQIISRAMTAQGRTPATTANRQRLRFPEEATTRCYVSTVTHGHTSALSSLLQVKDAAKTTTLTAPSKAKADTGHKAARYHKRGRYPVTSNRPLFVSKLMGQLGTGY